MISRRDWKSQQKADLIPKAKNSNSNHAILLLKILPLFPVIYGLKCLGVLVYPCICVSLHM